MSFVTPIHIGNRLVRTKSQSSCPIFMNISYRNVFEEHIKFNTEHKKKQNKHTHKGEKLIFQITKE